MLTKEEARVMLMHVDMLDKTNVHYKQQVKAITRGYHLSTVIFKARRQPTK